MEKTTITCDRCGEEIEKKNIFIYKQVVLSNVLVNGDRSNYIDLCPQCKESFVDWWNEQLHTP